MRSKRGLRGLWASRKAVARKCASGGEERFNKKGKYKKESYFPISMC